MKKVGLFVLLLVFLDNVYSEEPIQGNPTQDHYQVFQPKVSYYGYLPVDPTEIFFDEATSELAKKRVKFPILSSYVVVIKDESSVSAGYSEIASIAQEKGSYTVIMDYMAYTVAKAKEDEKTIGYAKIGVGLRIRASIVTKKKNVNIGGLLKIGIAASKNQLYGSLTVDSIGLASEDIPLLLPLNADIDQTSITAILQSLASIKSKIYDDKTLVIPCRLALKQSVPDKLTTLENFSFSDSYKQALATEQKKTDIMFHFLSFDIKKWQTFLDSILELSTEDKNNLKNLTNISSLNAHLSNLAIKKPALVELLYNKLSKE